MSQFQKDDKHAPAPHSFRKLVRQLAKASEIVPGQIAQETADLIPLEQKEQMEACLELAYLISSQTEFVGLVGLGYVSVIFPLPGGVVIGRVKTIEEFDALHERFHAAADSVHSPKDVAAFYVKLMLEGF